MTQTLYELTAEYVQLSDLLDEVETPEMARELAEARLGVESAIADKAEGIASIIKAKDRWADAVDAEIDRLKSKRDALRNRAAGLRNYLYEQMQAQGQPKLDTVRFNIRIQPNSVPTIKVVDPAAVPHIFERVVPARIEVDMDRVRQAVKDGEVIAGIEVVRGSHLRIS